MAHAAEKLGALRETVAGAIDVFNATVISVGTPARTGASTSATVTVNSADATRPWTSVAV